MLVKEESFLVFRVEVFHHTEANGDTREWRYVKFNPSHYGGGPEVQYVHDPKVATDCSEKTVDEVVRYLNALQKFLKYAGKYEFVIAKVSTSHESVSLDTGEYLEIRRKNAIEKLSPDDVKVLGVEKLAIYDKLKYHKS